MVSFFLRIAKMGHQQFHKNSANHVDRKVLFETMIFRIQLIGSLLGCWFTYVDPCFENGDLLNLNAKNNNRYSSTTQQTVEPKQEGEVI